MLIELPFDSLITLVYGPTSLGSNDIVRVLLPLAQASAKTSVLREKGVSAFSNVAVTFSRL